MGGNFVRGLLPYGPGIAAGIGAGRAGERNRRAQRVLDDQKAAAMETFTGGLSSAGSLDPAQLDPDKMGSIKQRLLGPDWQAAAMELGATPTSLMNFYKDLSPSEQEVFQGLTARDKIDYHREIELPEHRKRIVEASLGVEHEDGEEFDLSTLKTPNQVKIAIGSKLIDPETGARILAQFQEEPERPNIGSRDDAFDALQRQEINQEEYLTYDQYYSAQEDREAERRSTAKGEGAGGGGDELTTQGKMNEVQQRTQAKITELKGKVWEKKTTEEYKDLEDDEQEEFSGPDNNGFYWRERPEIVQEIQEQYDYLQDFDAQKRSMDSLQATLAPGPPQAPQPPANEPDPAFLAKVAAAKEMEAAGIKGVNMADPDFMTVYQAWKAAQGADVQ